jgi:peptide/nickel transport system ATP-binding protein
MKRGEVVDQGKREYILHQSDNAYTKLLLDAVPTLGGKRYV